MNTNILNKLGVAKHISKATITIKKYSPEILTTVGVAGVVTAGVFACKATLQLDPIVEETKANLNAVKHLKDEGHYKNDHDHIRDVTIIYTKGVSAIAKLYAPAVTLGLGSIACIIGAHGIMKKRNAALAVAYNALEKTFARYRDRVVEELGEDQERDIRLNIREEEVTDENGKKNIVKVVDPNGISQYAKFFDELNVNWQKDPNQNLLFLTCQQNWANDKLKANGHLFLNEVYDLIGVPRTQAGAVVGWVIGDEDGDDFVDFGIFNPENDMAREFVNGYEKAILLDFNVQGTIYDRI